MAGFTPPSFALPDNFHFHSIGDFEDYPVDKWSNALLDLLHQYRTVETSVIMLEDYWITRQVDRAAVDICHGYIQQFGYVLKICLTGDRLYSWGMQPYGHAGHVDLIISDPESQYQMSMMTGVWNHTLIKKVLLLGETPWQVEIEGTPRVRALKDEMIILGTRQWPVRHTLALRGGDSGLYLFDEIDHSDIQELIDADCFSEEAKAQAVEFLRSSV